LAFKIVFCYTLALMKKTKFEKTLINIERFLPLILMCCFIFIQSSRPAVAVSYVGWFNFFLHKLAHVIVFSLLFLFACRAFRDKKMALIFTILYAISDEYHQSYIVTEPQHLQMFYLILLRQVEFSIFQRNIIIKFLL